MISATNRDILIMLTGIVLVNIATLLNILYVGIIGGAMFVFGAILYFNDLKKRGRILTF